MDEKTTELETGTNPSELFTSTETREIGIEYNDKLWKFAVRDLTWNEKNQIISQSTGMRKAGKGVAAATFDVNKYNQLYLEKCVVESPFEMNRVNFLKLNAEFGDLLISNIVEKGEEVTEDEEGNW